MKSNDISGWDFGVSIEIKENDIHFFYHVLYKEPRDNVGFLAMQLHESGFIRELVVLLG